MRKADGSQLTDEDYIKLIPNKGGEEFICGWGAAFINVIITFPINKAMFRQMLHGVESHTAFNQLKVEGFPYLYRGIFPPLVQKTCSVALMFGIYDHSYQEMQQMCPGLPKFAYLSAAAMLAGTTEALLTPLERIQTLLQDSHYHNRFQNSWHAFLDIRKYGLREFYRGLVPILLRNGPSNVMFFGLRTHIKQKMPQTDHWFGNLVIDFINGAVIGALISTIFYPVNVVKTRMQVKIGGDFPSFTTVFYKIYEERERNWRRMFYGVHLNYTRALLSWGIINASYEMLKKVFTQAPHDD